RLPPRRVDLGGDLVADHEAAALELADVAESLTELMRVADREARLVARQRARVADLTAALGVERRAVEHDGAFGARLERFDRALLRVEQCDDAALARKRRIAHELGRRVEGRPLARRRGKLARLAR